MTRLALRLYAVLLGFGLPFYRLMRRLRGRPVAPAAARSRDFPAAGERPLIWLHGVSVGEVLAARRLVVRLREEHPGHEIVISTTTTAGMDAARRVYPDHRLLHFPYDLPGAVRRALDAIRPELVLRVELEVWPRFLFECDRREIPVAIVNARVSERSARGYRRLLGVLPGLFDPVRLIATQDETQAERMRALGLPEGRIRVIGNIKVDNLPPIVSGGDGREARRRLGLEDEFLLFGGSTHEGEEAELLAAILAIRTKIRQARLVLAPRHVERVGEVETLCSSRSLASRGIDDRPDGGEPVLLVDMIGEQAGLLPAADLIFLGGSLVPVGGHNLLEGAAAARVQLVGEHQRTMTDLADELEACGALHRVRDGEQIARLAMELASDRAALAKSGAAGRALVETKMGASDRALDALRELRLP